MNIDSTTAVESSRVGLYPEQLRLHPLRFVLFGLLIIWILGQASNFRFPFSPIDVHVADKNSAMRQLVFGGTGIFAGVFLFLTRGIGPIVSLNLQIWALSAFIGLSVLWSDVPLLTVKRAGLYFCGLLTLLTVVHASHKPVQFMVKVIFCSCTVIAVSSLLLHFFFPEPYSVHPIRPGLSGISGHPNELAPFASIGLILSLCIPSGTFPVTVALRFGQIMFILVLLLTMSVTTLITTIWGILFYIFLSAQSYWQGILQLTTIAVITIVSLIGWGRYQEPIL